MAASKADGQAEFVKQLKTLGVDVSRETLSRLETYAALLVKWQAKINLVGPATLPDLWRRHFLDSAQLLPLLPPAPGTLVDLGSGAGFPGLVLALMTEWRVHLIDSDQRKCALLRQVALDTGVNTRVAIHAQRFEDVPGYKAAIVTARACAPLDALLGHAVPFLGENGRCLFLKGAQVEEELTAAEANWNMQVTRRPSLTDPAGVILVIDHLEKRKR